MDTLFSGIHRATKHANAPLAARMRPQTLEGYVGQTQAVGEGSWLRRAIEHDTLSSVLLYGPAGTGKTTLAHIIANSTHAAFVEVSAITGTVKDLRREIEAAESRLLTAGTRTILFIDEIHRFNRSQQDALLHAVEDRTVVLIGATTENPYFEVNSALISRSRVVELYPLDDEAISHLIECACKSSDGLAGAYTLNPDALQEIVTLAGGDARAALTSLELASQMASPAENTEAKGADQKDADQKEPIVITLQHVLEANPRRGLPYDKAGDMHYDVISAFIKSMRGSDPDAALYWLARMIDAGEDPKFIARRIMILASEDIGNADPEALLIAEAAFRSAEVIGYPECRINLAQAVLYMALAPKSNAAEAEKVLAVRFLRICETVTDPVRMSMEPICTPTITPEDGSSNATCPKVFPMARSSRRPIEVGRRGGLMPLPATEGKQHLHKQTKNPSPKGQSSLRWVE